VFSISLRLSLLCVRNKQIRPTSIREDFEGKYLLYPFFKEEFWKVPPPSRISGFFFPDFSSLSPHLLYTPRPAISVFYLLTVFFAATQNEDFPFSAAIS